MKRLLSTVLCAIIIINFIFASLSYAETVDDTPTGTERIAETEMTIKNDTVNEMLYEGSTTNAKTGETESFNLMTGLSGIFNVVLGYIAMIIDVIPLTVELVITMITMDGADIIQSEPGGDNEIFFSIEKAVFNEIGMFDIDYFNFDTTYKAGEKNVYVPNLLIKMKESIATWFILCRMIAMVVGLGILIYIGIRMAISSVASDKVRYKKMLMAWVESMIILFLMQYIIEFVLTIGKLLLDMCWNLRLALENSGEDGFEKVMINGLTTKLFTTTGGDIVMYSIMFWFLVYSHTKFFLIYIKRMVMFGFLIVIGPLITITYPIDKMGDNKAQAFSAWFSELLINVFIQPVHAIIYLVFVFTAGKIAVYAPVLGLIFLMLIASVEKMVRSIFSMKDSVSVQELKKIGKGKKG